MVFIVCRSSVTHTMPFNGGGYLSGWRWSHRTQRGLQWTRETTHSFQAWKNMWAEETLSRKVHILASTSSVAFWTCNTDFLLLLHSCHKCFSHYRQPPSLYQSVLYPLAFAGANAKSLIVFHLVYSTYGPPQLRRITVAIDTLQCSCVVGADHTLLFQQARGVSLILWRCELFVTAARLCHFSTVPQAFKWDGLASQSKFTHSYGGLYCTRVQLFFSILSLW